MRSPTLDVKSVITGSRRENAMCSGGVLEPCQVEGDLGALPENTESLSRNLLVSTCE